MPELSKAGSIYRVSDVSDPRIGKNEAIFRVVNERIEAGELPASTSKRIAFCCECARLGCNALVEVTIAEYEQIRSNPRRFLLAVGHEVESTERVVEKHDEHIVVEKTGLAGAVAQASDPRS
jgi:hypothetical protein